MTKFTISIVSYLYIKTPFNHLDSETFIAVYIFGFKFFNPFFCVA